MKTSIKLANIYGVSSASKRIAQGLKLLFTVVWLLFLTTAPSLAEVSESDQLRIADVTKPTQDFSNAEPFEVRSGGAATVFKIVNRDSFSHPSANMAFESELSFKVGNGIFRKIWVSAPSSTKSSDGLGPLFNARSCQRCHIKDGRGHPPVPGERAKSMLLRISIPPQNSADLAALRERRKSVIPEPVYGTQIQNFSVQGVHAEGDITIHYKEKSVMLADGEAVSLRVPTYGISGLHYGPLHSDVLISPRVAPPIIGMGLLEAISEIDILANTDTGDEDGDGISGRTNWVWSDEHHKVMLGRFGWKAGQPTIVQQAAGAFRADIGISTPLYQTLYGDCTSKQNECQTAPHGGTSSPDGAEAHVTMFDLLTFYSRNLAVPARRKADSQQVLEGKRLFYESHCISCHTPKFVTARDSIGSEQSFQLIWPYTDLLLHDMGEGLADHRPEGEATGSEWRTPPLWGIGLTETVNGHTMFLHDGRARNLLEAILWHGGEAENSKQHVVNMTRGERMALLTFLRSL